MRMQSNTPSRKVATLKMTQAVVQWLSKASPRVENAIAIVTPKNKAHWAHSLLNVPMLMGSGASAGFVWVCILGHDGLSNVSKSRWYMCLKKQSII